MSISIIDGNWIEEHHFKNYIIRAVRHQNNVTIWDLFPETGGVYINQELDYQTFQDIMNKKETLVNAFGANY